MIDERDGPTSASSRIVEAQHIWAKTAKVPMLDHRHTATVEWNLFQPISDEARRGILQGDGNELSNENSPPRLSNLRSSTALSLNVFDPWVAVELGPLTEALGIAPSSRIQFEQKFSTGLRGTSPNLDVLLDTPDRSEKPTAVEVKFVEPYDGQSNEFRDSYFVKPEIWAGLPHLKEIAETIQHATTLKHLKTAQLIKARDRFSQQLRAQRVHTDIPLVR